VEFGLVKRADRFVAKVLSLGRVTIPEQIRRIWKIEEGDLVELQIYGVYMKSGEPRIPEEVQGQEAAADVQ
jgi:bifunctional DNA-binding transcriptional regulator/antitoxin component of YhaV-PrlF toxin-antitoxin module